MVLPQHTPAWVLNSHDGMADLDYIEQLPLPALGKDQILVKIHAASLNYRDLMINKVNHFLFCYFVERNLPRSS